MSIQKLISDLIKTERTIDIKDEETSLKNPEIIKIRTISFIRDAFKDKVLKDFIDNSDGNNLDLGVVQAEFELGKEDTIILNVPSEIIHKFTNSFHISEIVLKIKSTKE